MTAEFEKAPVSVTYLDENGEEQTANAIPLDGTETTINSGWYVVNHDVYYTSQLEIDGDVKLILGDGCTLDVTTNSDYSSVWQKSGTDKAFTVY